MTGLVSSLANQIIALINSKPSSPTKEEIEAVLRDALTGVTSHDDDPMTREPFKWSEPTEWFTINPDSDIDYELVKIASNFLAILEEDARNRSTVISHDACRGSEFAELMDAAMLTGHGFVKHTYTGGSITTTRVSLEDVMNGSDHCPARISGKHHWRNLGTADCDVNVVHHSYIAPHRCGACGARKP